MFRFGYDFYNNDTWEVLRPNGVLNQENADGRVFKLYLPPWWGHLLKHINLNFEVRSVEDLSGKELTTKWVYLLEPLGDPYGWLGYEQEWLDSSDQYGKKIIDSLFSGISETALKSVRNDKAIICIWHAQEAPNINHVGKNLFEEFHKELKLKNINPSNFVFVNGNLKTKSQYKYWKRNSEYNDQKDIHMIEFSSWRHVDYPKTWNLANFDENKIIKKKFLCFNRNLIHPHRLVLLTMLYERNLLSSGMVSFDKIQKDFHFKLMEGNLKHYFKFGRKIIDKKLKTLKELVVLSPSVVDVDEWETNHMITSYEWPYEQTFFSLVSETNFVQDTIFLTEKIWKAIANKHPFIIAGNHGVIKHLRDEGFKTYHPYIDESYDEIKNPYKRMVKIVDEVERLSQMNDKEIKSFLTKIKYIAEHNYKILIKEHTLINKAFNEIKEITK